MKRICVRPCARTECRHRQPHHCVSIQRSFCPHLKRNKLPCISLDKVMKASHGARINSNRKSRCRMNHIHDSGLEANICNDLHTLKRSGAIKNIESQYKIEIMVCRHHICNHYVDFFVEWRKNPIDCLPTGSLQQSWHTNTILDFNFRKTFVEAKGPETDIWRMKHRLVQAVHPETPYIVLKKRLFN